MLEADSGYPKTPMKELPGTNGVHARTNWRNAIAAYTDRRVLQVAHSGFPVVYPSC